MPVLNANIRAFHSYVESWKSHNLYFMARPQGCPKPARRGQQEDWKEEVTIDPVTERGRAAGHRNTLRVKILTDTEGPCPTNEDTPSLWSLTAAQFPLPNPPSCQMLA